ncbi:MAG TPA: hypothetical protein PKY77_25890 [Phycisphaerae bacterium]|nr:hypothetical protein [Phycisphaerae bacterium]HRY66850.1 hypothetical protein [Phycisphaerae bacterium]HSA26908.1 hypothetical protein [Phycisphaerae bacterium]
MSDTSTSVRTLEDYLQAGRDYIDAIARIRSIAMHMTPAGTGGDYSLMTALGSLRRESADTYLNPAGRTLQALYRDVADLLDSAGEDSYDIDAVHTAVQRSDLAEVARLWPLVEPRLLHVARVITSKPAAPDGKTEDAQAVSPEVAWDADDRNYQSIRELLGGYSPQPMSESKLSKLCKPGGLFRYMRKLGRGCRVHVHDFEAYIKSQGLLSVEEQALSHAAIFLQETERTKQQIRNSRR